MLVESLCAKTIKIMRCLEERFLGLDPVGKAVLLRLRYEFKTCGAPSPADISLSSTPFTVVSTSLSPFHLAVLTAVAILHL